MRSANSTCWGLNWKFAFLPMFLWPGCCHKCVHNCHLSWTHSEFTQNDKTQSRSSSLRGAGRSFCFLSHLSENSYATLKKFTHLPRSCETPSYLVSQWKIIKAVMLWITASGKIQLLISPFYIDNKKVLTFNYQIMMSIAASERRWDGQNFAGSVKFAIYIDIQADEPNHWRQREDDPGRRYYECLITPRPGTRSLGEKKFILRCELDARFFLLRFLLNIK